MREVESDYEYNQLPEDSEHEQKRRTEFDSPEEKLAYDAAGLIALAKERYKKDIVTVAEALDFATREDDDPEALRRAIAIQIKNGDLQEAELKDTSIDYAEVPADLEAITAHLKQIHDNTKNSPEIPENFVGWEAIAQKFLENPSALEDLNALCRPVIYFFDEDGYPEIADGVLDVTEMTEFMGGNCQGLEYKEVRYLVHSKEDENGNEVPTLHELFPYRKDDEKSPEIEAFEAATGGPFVYPKEGEQYCSSWLESGDDSSSPRDCVCTREVINAFVSYDNKNRPSPRSGVRRRLRVSRLFGEEAAA